jgi:hypothetical protein
MRESRSVFRLCNRLTICNLNDVKLCSRAASVTLLLNACEAYVVLLLNLQRVPNLPGLAGMQATLENVQHQQAAMSAQIAAMSAQLDAVLAQTQMLQQLHEKKCVFSTTVFLPFSFAYSTFTVMCYCQFA